MTAQELRHPPGKYRLTVEDYAMLDAAGTFGDARTELIEGDVILISPQFRPHGMVKLAFYDALRDTLRASGSPLTVVVEFSLAIGSHSIPEPDIMLTSEPSGDGAVPLASVALVVEVADTTLHNDLGAKATLYATAGIPEYWVVDVGGQSIHQMWSPAAPAYSERRQQPLSDCITAQTISGLAIELLTT